MAKKSRFNPQTGNFEIIQDGNLVSTVGTQDGAPRPDLSSSSGTTIKNVWHHQN